MSLQIGIVGLPNVGKSTLFNALLKKQQALAANYPFATIEPNVGVVPVPDHRLDALADMIAQDSIAESTPMTIGGSRMTRPPIVPATIEFVDIAGLVKNAAQGEGLGNQFLSHIREVDAIAHVVREFQDSNVIHVEGRVDPESDQQIIQTELLLADLAILERAKRPNKGSQTKEEITRQDTIEQVYQAVERGDLDFLRQLSTDNRQQIKDLNLLSLKPVIYIHNVDESQLTNPVALPPGHIRVNAQLEAELAALSEEDQQAYLADLGITQSGLSQVIQTGYTLLNLMSFLTAGDKEVRAWTITRGTKAPQAAGTIHTDFEQKFIRAEVVNWQDLVGQGGWTGAKAAGLVRMEGRDYVVQDGDVIVVHHS